MVRTAQTGLGPGTVTLSIKVFIVMMCHADGRLGGICSADQSVPLPQPLHMNRDEMIQYFCTAGCKSEPMINCGNDQQSSNPLCSQICNSGGCNDNCWITASPSVCNENQNRICGYSNADVCRNNNGETICVYTRSPSSAFCICQHLPQMTYTRCEPPAFMPTELNNTAQDTTSKSTAAQATTGQATTAPATTAQATTAQATAALATAAQATAAQATTARSTTAQATTAPATVQQATTARVTAAQTATAKATAAQGSTANQPAMTVAIVLGCLFALLLLLVIIGAVILHLRRQGRLPSFMKQAASPSELSSVQLEARSATRAKLPEPLVHGSGMEYSYAYDNRPAKPADKKDPIQDYHTYYSIGEGSDREGSLNYILDGQRKIPAKELGTATDNAKDRPSFVLNRDEEEDEPINESGGEHTDKVDVTDSSTGVESKEGNDEDYTPLVPTGNPKSRTEKIGDEVAVALTSSKATSPIESPTEGITNGDDGTYFPLIQTAEPKSQVEQPGYEDAKIPTPESHDATSPTGAQSKSGDDDTYTALVQTVEPNSQKKHSRYEAAMISKHDSDVTSPYDHFKRKEENETKEGALSTVDVDDYQHFG